MAGRTRECLGAFAVERAMTVAMLGARSQSQLDFVPRQGQWSIGETADHLLLAEQLYRTEIEALVALARAGQPARRTHTFAEINISPLGLPAALLSRIEKPLTLMNRMMPDALRAVITELPVVPARNPDMATPRHGRLRDDLMADLAHGVARTKALILDNADLDFSAMVSEHPLMGVSTVPQILTFLARHERRHQRQMDAVRTAAGFPAA